VPRISAIFDTNVYRGIGDAAFNAQRVDERQHSVVPMAGYVVAIELLSHLADPADADFAACLNATRRLGEHCSRWNGSGSSVEFMLMADAQIASQLFNKVLGPRATGPGGVAAIIDAIVANPCLETLRVFQGDLAELRDGVARAEATFAEKLWKSVVLTLAPDARDWQRVVKSPRGHDS
jgi:hypothetical protein